MSRFMYHCAQIVTRQHNQKKGRHEGAKLRDKERMDTFKCNGWLHITIMEGENSALVKLKHEDQHVPYWSIDVPEDVQEYVRSNLNMTPTQVVKLKYSDINLTVFFSYGMRF